MAMYRYHGEKISVREIRENLAIFFELPKMPYKSLICFWATDKLLVHFMVQDLGFVYSRNDQKFDIFF
jgi:hypothetical protein